VRVDKSSENGQMVLLLMLILLVLLALTALAVDGGMVYSNRSFLQSAADSVSLAAADKITRELNVENSTGSKLFTYENFSCSNSQVQAAVSQAIAEARLRASASNILLDGDISDGHGVEVICNENSNRNGQDKTIDVLVKMVSVTDTAFAHLVYRSPIKLQVESFVRVFRLQPPE